MAVGLGARRRSSQRAAAVLARVLLPAALLAACGASTPVASEPAQVTLYTCVSDTTIRPVIQRFEAAHPGTKLKLYRAPTGDMNARVAADARSGGLRADVVWACDPLTMQGYVDQDLVGGWIPPEASAIPEHLRTKDYVGVAVLYMVAVHQDGTPAPRSWSDLTSADLTRVALPDPSFAASALGALGYFSRAPGYGLAFYERLSRGGAVQVKSPDNVTTGVAQGLYQAGITTANSAYAAEQSGSPVAVSWPLPGAIAIYGPIALAKNSEQPAAAKEFIAFVTSAQGQTTAAQAGSYPTLPGITGPTVPNGAPVVFPDWSTIGADRSTLLGEYQKIFGR